MRRDGSFRVFSRIRSEETISAQLWASTLENFWKTLLKTVSIASLNSNEPQQFANFF